MTTGDRDDGSERVSSIETLVIWGLALVVAFFLALLFLAPLTPEGMLSLATLVGVVGLVPLAIYAFWPHRG